MAQFDPLIISNILISLLFVLVLYYNLSINVLIPNFFGMKKFRGKKLETFVFYESMRQNEKLIKEQAY